MKTITLVQAPLKAPSRRVQFTCTGVSMTKQSFNDECDINQIMAKFQKTGMIDHINKNQPSYGDHSPADYHESLTIIREAEVLFNELPSSVRKKFNNQPDEFYSFVQNPENEAELYDLGLTNNPIPAEPSVEPDDPTIPPPTPSAGASGSNAAPAASE